MNASIAKWAICAVAVASSTAHAQTAAPSSTQTIAPTIYGRISTAIESASLGDSGSRIALKSYSSRLGIRGEQSIDEDKSLFYGIEAQVLSDSGATGLGGDLRNAYVGLRSNTWGTLVAGRLDPLVSAPLYLQLFKALDLVGFDNGNLQIIATGGRDTGSGSVLGRNAATNAPTGAISQHTQTLLARARVSNAFGYSKKFDDYELAARFFGDGPNDVVGISESQLGENSARALELAFTKKAKDWMIGAGIEVNTYSAPVSTLASRLHQRFQFVTSVTLGDLKLGATIARNTAEIDRANAKKSGGEYAVSAKMPIMTSKASFIVNYALRDLFGTDNSASTAADAPKPLASPGARRKQYAMGVHYDINPQTQSYVVYNVTDGNSDVESDELKVFSVGLKHQF